MTSDSSAGRWQRVDRLLARLRPHRQPASLVLDALVVAASWHITYLFRLGFERWFSARATYDHWVLLGVVACYALVFVLLGVPRGMWRFSGFGEIKRLAAACLLAGSLCAVVVLLAQLVKVPRAVLALHPWVALMGLCTVRLAYRMVYEHARSRISGRDADDRRAIVLGAGEAAKMLLATIHHQGWTVLGLLDDDPAKRGARIGGVLVLGTVDDVARPGISGSATEIIVAMPGASAAQRRAAIEKAAATGLPVLTVPSMSELQSGSARIERVRSIEPEDLLGREPVNLDEVGIADMISGKAVLVTGAGGSIGSELCRQIARYGPARIVLYELSEFALYQIDEQLAEAHPTLPRVSLIGDVKDFAHVQRTFTEHRPDTVFHAAAFKHVPLMEERNAWCALQNNTYGTWCVASAALARGVHRVVLISTDKAVNPTNVMGASKRAAEMVLSHLAAQGHATQFATVRFGNVLGSSGSVIPKFKEQIAAGGPVTVTHPDITRYFMTVTEAVRLVLQAAALARTGEVYVLDMGEPVKIVQLARDLIRLSGHREGEIGIVFSGLRPGEKLYEELLADTDQTLASPHPRLRIAQLHNRVSKDWLERLLAWLARPEPSQAPSELRRQLHDFVVEYRAQEQAAVGGRPRATELSGEGTTTSAS
jgi:FlaA1/EpsC-like NDP-sugar epimerase